MARPTAPILRLPWTAMAAGTEQHRKLAESMPSGSIIAVSHASSSRRCPDFCSARLTQSSTWSAKPSLNVLRSIGREVTNSVRSRRSRPLKPWSNSSRPSIDRRSRISCPTPMATFSGRLPRIV